MEAYCTAAELAARLHVSVSALRKAETAGRIPNALRIGSGGLRIYPPELADAVATYFAREGRRKWRRNPEAVEEGSTTERIAKPVTGRSPNNTQCLQGAKHALKASEPHPKASMPSDEAPL
jgi:hypothetical protein